MSVRSQLAAQVLWGSAYDSVLMEANNILEIKDRRERAEEALKLCSRVNDYRVIARIVAAMAACDFNDKIWLGKVVSIFGTKPPDLEIPQEPHQLIDGLVLGIFQAAKQFDSQQQSSLMEFGKEFPSAVVKIITGCNELLKTAQESYSDQCTSAGKERFPGDLSNAINAYVRRTETDQSGVKGKRLAQVQEITKKFCDQLPPSDNTKPQLTRWGELVLGNINCAFFGQLDPTLQAQTIYDCM